ncbi:GGDEF domain-containing protein [Marivita sp. S6314]|uniref:GGDEF domain-containing protein n=1 Tax=Marivita sp. S6314 TaxID=2926406 RepID=UPI001FF1EF46|nr:GGDEF domain-containing protein [Marivita sp. S6314]MCK0150656.1 GGDEF domain-containing protein [Marivita sp. S6314]
MISVSELLSVLRPLHLCIGKTGHITQVGRGFDKLGQRDLTGRRFLEMFEILRPSQPRNMAETLDLAGQVLRLRLRSEPDILLRGLVIADQQGGAIVDLSFGIAVVDAVQRFGLTAKDFAASDLAVELLFLQEAKSSAMSASFSLNARLNGARLAAEAEALTDGLTGLHNRRALDGALSQLSKTRTDFAVLHIDLDKFKQVNDTLGHAVGDALLKQAASVMRRCTRQDDLLVRAGGDEFVIICPGLVDELRLSELSQTLIKGLSAPITVDATEVAIGASVGVATSTPSTQHDAAHIIERADIALYAAKRSGRGRHVIWTPALGTRLNDLDIPHVSSR